MPDGKDVKWLSGTYRPLLTLADVNSDGIVIGGFDSRQRSFIENLTESSVEDFIFPLDKADQLSTSREKYSVTFQMLKDELAMGKIQKAVLSRIKVVDHHNSPVGLFQKLNELYSHSFNYLLHLPETGTWIGATPELLADFRGDHLETVAVAGTRAEGSTETWTEKEFAEHDFVVDYIKEILNEAGCNTIVTSEKKTVSAGPVKHLKTEISAGMSSSADWKTIIDRIHPTPAVCGVPLRESRKFILFNEGHNRRLYTGIIGLVGSKRKTFFVNLRCMELFEGKACIYVGGGITRQSDVNAEWEETERKAETMGKILGDRI